MHLTIFVSNVTLLISNSKTRMHSSRMHTACSSSHLLGEEGCLPQCMLGYTHTPTTHPHVGLETPLGVGLETPQPDPSTFPLGVGLETPWPDPSTSPWVWAWRPHIARPLNLNPGCGPRDLQGMLGYHPHPSPLPWTEFLTHASENITLPHLRCQKSMSKDTNKMLNQS